MKEKRQKTCCNDRMRRKDEQGDKATETKDRESAALEAFFQHKVGTMGSEEGHQVAVIKKVVGDGHKGMAGKRRRPNSDGEEGMGARDGRGSGSGDGHGKMKGKDGNRQGIKWDCEGGKSLLSCPSEDSIVEKDPWSEGGRKCQKEDEDGAKQSQESHVKQSRQQVDGRNKKSTWLKAKDRDVGEVSKQREVHARAGALQASEAGERHKKEEREKVKPSKGKEEYVKIDGKLLGKESKERGTAQAAKMPVKAGEFPFQADAADHAETPVEAYRDVAPILGRLAECMGLTRTTVRIYDPYYCDGGVVKRLKAQGFMNVYNKCEDFYKIIEEKRVPPFDILLTNPPYSLDHFEKIIKFAVAAGKPWLLLVPNFIYTKDYFKTNVLEQKRQKGCMYLVPNKRYTYWTPEWLHTTKYGVSTSPFPSFWFIQCLEHTDRLRQWVKARPGQQAVTIASDVNELPNEVRAAFDPLKKRPNPKMRKKLAKLKRAGIKPS